MNFTNSLKKAYSDTLSEIERQRKESALMIYCFYQNNLNEIKQYIEAAMRNSSVKNSYVYNPRKGAYDMLSGEGIGMFDEDTIRIFPKRHFDLVNKTLNNLCRSYKADRYLVNAEGDIDNDATNLLLELYEQCSFDITASEFYKQGKLFNTVLVEPVWRGKLEFDIHPPCFASVKNDPADVYSINELWIDREIELRGESFTGCSYWSKANHHYILGDGTIIPVEGNDAMINPYGEIPHCVLRFKKSSDFWGEPMLDLVENNIWYNIRENNLLFVEMFQGLGVGLAVNLGKRDKLQIKPNTIISVDNASAENIPPGISFSSTNTPLAELSQNAEKDYKRIANTKGLSAQSFSNEPNSQSGRAKMFDNAELETIVSDDLLRLKAFERNLFEKARKVYNTHNPFKPISQKLKFVIEIIEQDPVLTVDEKIRLWQFELDNGLSRKEDYIISKNTSLNEMEAKKVLHLDN